MVSLACVSLLCLVAALGQESGPAPVIPPAPEQFKTALGEGNYPWYDAQSDRLVPVLPWPDFGSWSFFGVGDWIARVYNRVSEWVSWVFRSIGEWFRGLNRWQLPMLGGAGDLLVIGLAMTFLTLILVLLLELLRRYRPIRDDAAAARAALLTGNAARIEGLPAGVSVSFADPWAEARRLRDRGDYTGAIIYLFAHQLITLNRLGHLRLVPGRTGRQLVRGVVDRQLRGAVEPTLRLFEIVYYGHRTLSAEVFEPVWSLAERFEQQVGAEAVT